MSTNIAPRRFAFLMVVIVLSPAFSVLADAEPAAPHPGYALLSDLVAVVDQAARGAADAAATNTALLTLAKSARAAAGAKTVDPIFAVRYTRLLSALRQGLLADPGMLYWPMYRASMMDFIEERTGRPPDWNTLVFVVGDHGGSGVGLALLVEPVMSEVVSLHIHLESLRRREAILESYMKSAAKSP
jgi:hypothetical protein